MSVCRLCGAEFAMTDKQGCVENDGAEHVKRGPGRPPKMQKPTVWAEVQPKTVVRVLGERGEFSFVKLADQGSSATVWSPNTGMRTFSLDRLVMK